MIIIMIIMIITNNNNNNNNNDNNNNIIYIYIILIYIYICLYNLISRDAFNILNISSRSAPSSCFLRKERTKVRTATGDCAAIRSASARASACAAGPSAANCETRRSSLASRDDPVGGTATWNPWNPWNPWNMEKPLKKKTFSAFIFWPGQSWLGSVPETNTGTKKKGYEFGLAHLFL